MEKVPIWCLIGSAAWSPGRTCARAAQARNVTVLDVFDLGDEVANTIGKS